MDNLNILSETIKSLLTIDDNIKELSSKQKILRKKRDLIEEKVLKILDQHNLQEKKFVLDNNAIFCTKSNTLPPLNVSLIQTILSRYINEKQVNFILKQIDDYRQNNRKDNIVLKRKLIKNKSLKRIKNK